MILDFFYWKLLVCTLRVASLGISDRMFGEICSFWSPFAQYGSIESISKSLKTYRLRTIQKYQNKSEFNKKSSPEPYMKYFEMHKNSPSDESTRIKNPKNNETAKMPAEISIFGLKSIYVQFIHLIFMIIYVLLSFFFAFFASSVSYFWFLIISKRFFSSSVRNKTENYIEMFSWHFYSQTNVKIFTCRVHSIKLQWSEAAKHPPYAIRKLLFHF